MQLEDGSETVINIGSYNPSYDIAVLYGDDGTSGIDSFRRLNGNSLSCLPCMSAWFAIFLFRFHIIVFGV